MSDEKNIKFEKGLEELEKIVSELESGELTLEDVLKRYEQGIKMSRLLQGRLEEATKKIEVLMKNADGSLKTQPLTLEGNEKKSASSSKKNSSTNEDLLI
jgi:exodeoxyribonuclease VII small subunit